MSRTLLDQWRDIAYDETADRGQLQRFWGTYFQIEKEIYEKSGRGSKGNRKRTG